MSRFPTFIRPIQPVLGSRPPPGAQWLHEVKFDGWRVQLHKRDDAITIFTKNGLDYTRRFPSIARVVAALPARSCIIDVELTACDDHGAPDFYALHFCRSQMLCVWTFDLLELNGRDARELPPSWRLILDANKGRSS